MSSTNARALHTQHPQVSLWRIKVIAEADSGVWSRIIQPLEGRNIIPYSLRVDRVGDSYLEIVLEIAVSDLPHDALGLIVKKYAQLPMVVAAVASQ